MFQLPTYRCTARYKKDHRDHEPRVWRSNFFRKHNKNLDNQIGSIEREKIIEFCCSSGASQYRAIAGPRCALYLKPTTKWNKNTKVTRKNLNTAATYIRVQYPGKSISRWRDYWKRISSSNLRLIAQLSNTEHYDIKSSNSIFIYLRSNLFVFECTFNARLIEF